MKKKLLAMLLAIVLAAGLLPGTVFAATTVPTQQQAQAAMIALQDQYYEGRPWTNADSYTWTAVPNTIIRGYGCAAFAFILSDAAFGDLPARKVDEVKFSDVRVGDILRINNDTHSVIILAVNPNSVTIAEGNYGTWTANGISYGIHWNRALTKAEVEAADYMYTRYPVEADTPTVPTEPVEPETPPAEPTKPELPTKFSDVPVGAYYANAVNWAVDNKITNGTGNKKFSPKDICSEGQILTMLYRASGETAATTAPIPVASWYQDAVNWAYEKGMIDDDFVPDKVCTRASAVYYIWLALGEEDALAQNFTDVEADAYYADAVSWAAANQVTTGVGNNQFNPYGTCTREQIVTLLYRACA